MSAKERIMSIMQPPEKPKLYTKEEIKIYKILEKYAATKNITDEEMMFLRSEGWKYNITKNNTSLLEITDAIERKQAREAHQKYITETLMVDEANKGMDLIQSMSAIDTFSVALTVCLGIVFVGFLYPKLKALLERSNRAAFVLMLCGFSSILAILRFVKVGE